MPFYVRKLLNVTKILDASYNTIKFFISLPGWEGMKGRGKCVMSKISKHTIGLVFLTGIGFPVVNMLLIGCAQVPMTGAIVDNTKLVDGIYEGSYRGGPNKALVNVTIKDNKIFNIEIIEHQAWKGKKAEQIIIDRIILSQSTKVDAVSGATNSSRVIMNAVQNAIEKAYQN